MQPAEKKSEVVYRRRNLPAALPSAEAATTDLAKRAFVRAITPLIIGFLLLLGLISWLGWRSASQMDNIGFKARELAFQTTVWQDVLSDLRLKATQVDTEMRVRHTAISQRGLTPPFDLKLDAARGDLNQTIALLNRVPTSDYLNWTKLTADL